MISAEFKSREKYIQVRVSGIINCDIDKEAKVQK